MVKKKKRKAKKKKFYEFFKIGKKGKIVKVKGKEEIKKESKGQITHQNKVLRNFFIFVGVIILIVVLFFGISYTQTNFKYKELKFKAVREGEIVFYNTAFPLYSKEGVHVADYNLYIRNDPRKLDKTVPFDGELIVLKNAVINSTGNFTCDGHGIIAIANLLKPFDLLGTKVIKDENATCDSQGRYMFLQIQKGEKTSIEQVTPSCYNINIANCEILEGTERFMLELFLKIKEVQSGKSVPPRSLYLSSDQ